MAGTRFVDEEALTVDCGTAVAPGSTNTDSLAVRECTLCVGEIAGGSGPTINVGGKGVN